MNWKTLSLVLIGVIFGMVVRDYSFTMKAFAAGGKKCDYTWLSDGGAPEIGKDGAIKYDDDWSKILNNGWKLFSAPGSGDGNVYIFEKCQ